MNDQENSSIDIDEIARQLEVFKNTIYPLHGDSLEMLDKRLKWDRSTLSKLEITKLDYKQKRSIIGAVEKDKENASRLRQEISSVVSFVGEAGLATEAASANEIWQPKTRRQLSDALSKASCAELAIERCMRHLNYRITKWMANPSTQNDSFVAVCSKILEQFKPEYDKFASYKWKLYLQSWELQVQDLDSVEKVQEFLRIRSRVEAQHALNEYGPPRDAILEILSLLCEKRIVELQKEKETL